MVLKPEWVVAVLGLYIFVRLLHNVLNRMSREVPNPVRCAVALLLLPGAAGKAIAIFTGEFNDYVDVLLLGGLALFFAVERRTREEPPLPEWRLQARASAIILAVALGLVASSAHAQKPSERPVYVADVKACVALGYWVAAITDFRDAGATLEAVLPIVRKRNAEQPRETVDLMVRETRRVYERAELDGEKLAGEAFDRCAFGLLKP